MRLPDYRSAAVGFVATLLALGLVATQLLPLFRKLRAAPVFTAEWFTLPTTNDLLAVYPDQARGIKFDRPIRIELKCIVTNNDGIDACVVVKEDPPGYGFGQAAVKLAPKFRLSATVAGGESLAGYKMTVPIRFDTY